MSGWVYARNPRRASLGDAATNVSAEAGDFWPFVTIAVRDISSAKENPWKPAMALSFTTGFLREIGLPAF